MSCSRKQNASERDERTVLVPCPCGEEAVWYKARATPEKAPEHAVCFLTDGDFADNYCEACFALAAPATERAGWEQLP